MVCTFHFLNIELLKEWFATCNEYLGFTLKPFTKMSFRDIWTCKDKDWEAALTVWAVLTFWVAVVYHCARAVIVLVGDIDLFGAYLGNLLTGVIGAYLMSHIFWFGSTKKQGCCCCILCCFQGPLLLLIMAILCLLSGLSILGDAVSASQAGSCGLCILFIPLSIIYDICLIYLGICLFMLWQKAGKEIVPPAVEVVGPTIGKV